MHAGTAGTGEHAAAYRAWLRQETFKDLGERGETRRLPEQMAAGVCWVMETVDQ